MRWDDLTNDVWKIATESGEKGNAGRLRLPPLAMSIINEIDKVAGCSFVFAGRYGDRALNNFSQGKADINALLPADMPRWTLHDLRRTARTLMSELRIDHQTAELVLGHSIGGGGVAAVYDRSEYFEQKAEALAILSSYLQSIVE
jgi:integrase